MKVRRRMYSTSIVDWARLLRWVTAPLRHIQRWLRGGRRAPKHPPAAGWLDRVHDNSLASMAADTESRPVHPSPSEAVGIGVEPPSRRHAADSIPDNGVIPDQGASSGAPVSGGSQPLGDSRSQSPGTSSTAPSELPRNTGDVVLDREPTTTSEPYPGTVGSGPGPREMRPRATGSHRLDWQQIRAAFMNADWRWLYGGTLVGSLTIGYLIAAVFFFPAAFFNPNRPVPSVIGQRTADAQTALEGAGLVPGEIQFERHPSRPRGTIVWQDPPADVLVPAGTTVRLFESRGPQEVPVPDVGSYEASLARMLITNSGLVIGRVDSIQTALPRGVVVATRPAPGATLPPGSRVVLIVSRGRPTMSVPDLAGLTLEEAQEVLELAGLTIGRSWREFSNAQAEGLVFRQEPPAGTLIAPGTQINVVIARPP